MVSEESEDETNITDQKLPFDRALQHKPYTAKKEKRGHNQRRRALTKGPTALITFITQQSKFQRLSVNIKRISIAFLPVGGEVVVESSASYPSHRS